MAQAVQQPTTILLNMAKRSLYVVLCCAALVINCTLFSLQYFVQIVYKGQWFQGRLEHSLLQQTYTEDALLLLLRALRLSFYLL